MRYLRNLTLGLVVLLVILWLGVSFRGYLSAQTTLQQWKAIHPCDADAVAFSVDGSLLAVTCSQDHVYVYRFPQLTREATLPVKEGRAFSAAFAPRRAVLAVAEWAGGLTLWDSTRWTRLREVGAPGRTNAVAWSPEGSLLAASVGASGWCVSVYKTEGYQEVYRFTAQGSSAFGPGFASVTFLDSQRLVAGGLDGCVYVWHLARGRLLHRLCGHTQPIWRVAVLPKEGLIASSSLDNTVVIWDWRRGKQVATISGAVVASCPAKGLFAVSSATSPGVLQLWDARGSRLVASQRVRGQRMMDMAFSADGKYLVTVGSGQGVVVWRVGR